MFPFVKTAQKCTYKQVLSVKKKSTKFMIFYWFWKEFNINIVFKFNDCLSDWAIEQWIGLSVFMLWNQYLPAIKTI